MTGFTFNSVGFVGLLSSSPAPPAALDKTRYTFFGTAAGAGNTNTLWLDESGRGNHLVPNGGYLLGDAATGGGKTSYYSSGSNSNINVPFTATGAKVTIYALVTLTGTDTNPFVYFLSAYDFSMQLGINNTETGAYYPPVQSVLSVPANTRSLIVWRLDAATNTGRVYLNGSLLLTGTYAETIGSGNSKLGSYSGFQYGTFRGLIEAFAVRQGTESDADFAATSAYLNTL